MVGVVAVAEEVTVAEIETIEAVAADMVVADMIEVCSPLITRVFFMCLLLL